MDTERRTLGLQRVADGLIRHFGHGLFVRLGPSPEFWRESVLLQVFAPNTRTASVELEADENELYLIIGDAIDSILFERKALDDEAFTWAERRIITAGERGIELWRDRRRQLLGGSHRERIVGEDFEDVSDKHRLRLSLAETTAPWTDPGNALLADPIAAGEGASSVFLVDTGLSETLKELATVARREFGSAISLVTRRGSFGEPRYVEVLPTDREASRMRIRQSRAGTVEFTSGNNQYFEYEFTTVPLDSAVDWLVNAGRWGVMETTVRRGPVYRYVTGPATPGAVAAVQSNPRAHIDARWRPWSVDPPA